LKEKGDKESELETVKNTSSNQMWLNELDKLREVYMEYKEERERMMNGTMETKKKKVVNKKKPAKQSLIVVEDEE